MTLAIYIKERTFNEDRLWTIKPYHDTRKAVINESGEETFKVVIRTWNRYDRERLDTDTKLKLTRDEYVLAMHQANPRGKNLENQKKIIISLDIVFEKTKDILTIDDLKQNLRIPKKSKETIQGAFDLYINERQDQLSSVVNDTIIVKHLLELLPKDATFDKITTKKLNELQDKLQKNCTENTIKTYMGHLRAFFNAKAPDGIPYPFYLRKNKDGFKIPIGNEVEKALKIDELEKIKDYTSDNYINQRSRDIFWISFIWAGANMTDICTLKWNDLKDDCFTIKRQKTSKKTNKTLKYYINTDIEEIINKYKGSGRYVFNFMSSKTTIKAEIRAEVKDFTRSINNGLKKIAKELNIGGFKTKIRKNGKEFKSYNLSTYYARYTSTTLAIESGENLNLIKQSNQWTSFNTMKKYIDSSSSKEQKNMQERKSKLYKSKDSLSAEEKLKLYMDKFGELDI
tara:strand:- start:220 stop:1587 length:1368 start_codon:yes stop_codon:yes gene_type:complete